MAFRSLIISLNYAHSGPMKVIGLGGIFAFTYIGLKRENQKVRDFVFNAYLNGDDNEIAKKNRTYGMATSQEVTY